MKKSLLVISNLVLFIILIVFMVNRNDNNIECPKCSNENTNYVYIDDLEFLNKLDTNNKVCALSKLNLYRCNNIIEEKYDINNNLIYLKTKEKEYFYNYIYDEKNRVKIFTFNNIILNINYDNNDRINNIDYINNGELETIKYEYLEENKPYIDNSYYIPTKITVYKDKKVEYYYIYERIEEKIIEHKYINNIETKKELINFSNRDLNTFFKKINYIPEPYYNPIYNNCNHGEMFSNFSYFNISDYKIQSDGNEIKSILYKDSSKYYKEDIVKKNFNNKTYYEIFKKEEIIEEDFKIN